SVTVPSVMLPPPLMPALFPYTTLFRSSLRHLQIDADSTRRCTARGARAHRGNSRCHIDRDTGGNAGYNASNGNASPGQPGRTAADRKSTRLNSSHVKISYAVFCLKKKT